MCTSPDGLAPEGSSTSIRRGQDIAAQDISAPRPHKAAFVVLLPSIGVRFHRTLQSARDQTRAPAGIKPFPLRTLLRGTPQVISGLRDVASYRLPESFDASDKKRKTSKRKY